MLKRTCKPYFSKHNGRLEHDAVRLGNAGQEQAAITLLDQSDALLKQLKALPKDRRRRLKQALKAR